jgi:menaquinone-dependent protoporphyrinogen oxidase
VAEAIGDVLREAGAQVHICRAREAKDVDSYQAVIVGVSVHAGQLSREVIRFVRRYRQVLARVPVAYFCVCLAASEDTEENRTQTASYVAKLRQAAPEIEPVDQGIFAGVVLADTPEFKRLFPLFKIPVQAMAEQPDHRDWEAIRAWAQEIGPKLLGTTS